MRDPNANTGAAQGDTYIDVENLSGTDLADILIGNSGPNSLFGNGGDDRLEGWEGNDSSLVAMRTIPYSVAPTTTAWRD
ncbi:hypothetical protein E6W36_15095 [Hankyongella ginsenosidimutans]|uniref:Calcium-binding protein n=1 Tax=Hankyongella ginsenosidimutans TaxID=1763828 RepID=A0A4D7BZ25_9SPHN|nr:hypothetical protein E6W36_15095 [Hankyongella ginsenosidimutans]